MTKRSLLGRFIIINKNTKKARGIIAQYEYSKRDGNSIYNAYTKPSNEKKEAFAYCQKLLSECKGKNPKITGRNCYYFSYAFKCQDEDGNWYLIYITASADYIICL